MTYGLFTAEISWITGIVIRWTIPDFYSLCVKIDPIPTFSIAIPNHSIEKIKIAIARVQLIAGLQIK